MKAPFSFIKYCGVALVGSLIPSRISAHLAMSFASSTLARFRVLRIIFDYSLPSTQTETSSSPVIVMIPATKKDLHRIPLVIESVFTHSLNPIHEVVLISPVIINLPDNIVRSYPVSFMHDSRIISDSILSTISTQVPIGRIGWIIQQVIKLKYSALSSYPVVVLDADTVFLRDTLFIDRNSRQLLQFSYEWHAEYERHYRNFLGARYKDSSFHMSFVTHYQVMQKDLVRQFLGVENEIDIDDRLLAWIKLADFSVDSPISEYHSYGRFLSDFFPNRFRIESWRNFDSRNQNAFSKLVYAFLKFRSYSLHVIS